jgi:hypothetical protein
MSKRYVAHFVTRIMRHLTQGYTAHFVTLTVDPKVRVENEDGTYRPLTPGSESRKWLHYVWSGKNGGGGFREKIRYRTHDLHYVGAAQQAENGHYHLHLLVIARWKAGRDPVCELRECWKSSKGGAVADVKLLRKDGCSRGEDGRPETVAGAAGYVVKYIFRDEAEAARRGESRRSLVSQGFGYYSDKAKAARRSYVEKHKEEAPTHCQQAAEAVECDTNETRESESEPPGRTVQSWTLLSPRGRGSRRRRQTLTPHDAARFERADLSRCTNTYREKIKEGVYCVHVYDQDGSWSTHLQYRGRPNSPHLDGER